MSSPLRFANLSFGDDNPLRYAVSLRDRSTLAVVKEAVRQKQTLMAYQPVIRDISAGTVAFYEGFIRVLDPTGRVIPARDFMPLVEETQLGRDIDVQSLHAGLIALSRTPHLRLSINMSARSIGYTPWVTLLNEWLEHDLTIAERLILEISEKSAMQMPELVASFMDQMQPKGVCFALDNFGSGYCALRYLKDMFFDILKIDRQFIQGIATDADNRTIVSVMLGIAEKFNMATVAEQVENFEDSSLLLSLGVDCQQGFLFGTPTIHPYWEVDAELRKNG